MKHYTEYNNPMNTATRWAYVYLLRIKGLVIMLSSLLYVKYLAHWTVEDCQISLACPAHGILRHACMVLRLCVGVLHMSSQGRGTDSPSPWPVVDWTDSPSPWHSILASLDCDGNYYNNNNNYHHNPTCNRVEIPAGASSWLLLQIQTAGTTQSRWLENSIDIEWKQTVSLLNLSSYMYNTLILCYHVRFPYRKWHT